MDYQEFKNWVATELKGHYDHDNKYGAECADLAKGVCQHVLGAPIGAFGGDGSAFNGWENKNNTFPEDRYERIENSEIPKILDIVIFNKALSPFGHVGIIDDNNSTKTSINVYDQLGNGAKVGGEKTAGVRKYNTKNVLGFWRLKTYKPTQDTTTPPQPSKSAIEEVFDSLPDEYKNIFSDYSSEKPITEADCRRLIVIGLFRKP